MRRINYPTKKYNKILRILAAILPLLAVFILGTPASAAPVIALSPNAGAVGTQVTVTGTNFESYRGDRVSIYFDDEEIMGSLLTIPQTGSFSLDLTIPADATPGRHWISIKIETGSTLATNFFIIPETKIELSRVVGTVGTKVSIDGEGFYVGKMVTLYYYNRTGEKVGTEVAGTTGEFSFQFNIPDSIAGRHKIAAENAEGNSAEAEFQVLSSTTLNLTSGAPGDVLTIKGTGFGYKSDISIYFDIDEVAYAKADEFGNFEATFNIPDMKSDNYDVKAIDEDGNTDKAKFTITAGASIDKTTGAIGSTLTVRGNGFEAGKTVTIKYDSLQVAMTTTGSFNTPRSLSLRIILPTVETGFSSSASTVGRIIRKLRERGVLKEPVANHISTRKRQRQRPYAIRKPKDYGISLVGDLVQLDTLDVRPLPGVLLKHFTAHDVISRWNTVGVYSRATATTAIDFLDTLAERMPFPVKAIQVDGGAEFEAIFEGECQRRGIKLFVLPPRSPKLNGGVERAHRTHTEEFYEVTESSFDLPELREELLEWEWVYNTVRPHQALGYVTPLKFLEQRKEYSGKEDVSLII